MAGPVYSDATRAKLGDLLLKLTTNKATRPTITRAISKIDPTMKFSEHDTEDLRSEVMGMIENDKEEREKEAMYRRLAAQRKQVMEGFGPDPEAAKPHIEAVDKIVQETGLDFKRAAKLYAAENPPPPPRPEGVIGTKWEMPNVEELFTNQKAYETDLANQAISEIMASRKTA